MKLQRLAIIAFSAFVTMAVHGQLFHPLGLGIEKGERKGDFFQPQIHVEGDILYACTNQGLYSKDLSNGESEWHLVGFEGIPLQDYARRGDDIFALRYSYSSNYNEAFLLLSHDGGKTYEDVTPDMIKTPHSGWKMVMKNLIQHPTDPNLLLVLSMPMGVFQSADFGQSWNQLSDFIPDYIWYHPLNPEIICASGESPGFWAYMNTSYDGGQTWEYVKPDYPGDNRVNRMAFHPADLNRWIAGGFGTVYTSIDNGHTWNTQIFSGNRDALWRYTLYDNENPDIIYMAGDYYFRLMCSKDGGSTWNEPYLEPIKKTPREYVYDLKQYGDRLLVFYESDVYEISKAELLAQGATSVQSIVQPTTEDGALYDLSGRKISAEANSSFFTLHSSLKRGIYIEGGKKKVK